MKQTCSKHVSYKPGTGNICHTSLDVRLPIACCQAAISKSLFRNESSLFFTVPMIHLKLANMRAHFPGTAQYVPQLENRESRRRRVF